MTFAPVKVLIVRFSSLGDMVLTSPVLRCLKEQRPDIEIHYCTKKNMLPAIEFNPHIDKKFQLNYDLNALIGELKKEKYDLIIDLHRNLRTFKLKLKLGVPSKSFDKINLAKWLAVRFKVFNKLPDMHIVDRYFETIKQLGVHYDGKGLDFFTGNEILPHEIDARLPEKFHAYAIGGQHATKRLPLNKMFELVEKSNQIIVLLGSEDDLTTANALEQHFGNRILNLCGKLNLSQSALVVKRAQKVITHDSVMMHIAAAFNKDLISIWGNTIPEFGMYPLFSKDKKTESILLEVKNLPCRPCSKIGFNKCPQVHFDCMNKIDFDEVDL